MLHARGEQACAAVAVQEEDRRVRAQRGADELVRGGCGGASAEVGLVRGVERVREGEPGTERLVVGRLQADVVGFECCG